MANTRRILTVILLVVSVLFNVVLFVMVYIQKQATNNQIELVLEMKDQLTTVERECRAREEVANMRRNEAEIARVACEEKLVAVSNKKK